MPSLHFGFPGRAAGAGLLLLRIVIGVTLVIHAVPALSVANGSNFVSCVLCLLALAGGVSVIVGFLTRLGAVIAAVLAVGFTQCRFVTPPVIPLHSHPFDLNVIAIAVAIALLGPGAFSLDAAMFGRRRIIIPRSSLSSKP